MKIKYTIIIKRKASKDILNNNNPDSTLALNKIITKDVQLHEYEWENYVMKQ